MFIQKYIYIYTYSCVYACEYTYMYDVHSCIYKYFLHTYIPLWLHQMVGFGYHFSWLHWLHSRRTIFPGVPGGVHSDITNLSGVALTINST